MYRSASRALLRVPPSRQVLLRRSPPQRFISFGPPSYKAKSWKGSFLRWGLAIGGVYWYATSPLFRDDVADDSVTILPIYDTQDEDENLPTLNSILSSRAQKRAAMTAPNTDAESGLVSPPSATPNYNQAQTAVAAPPQATPAQPFPAETASGSPAELEEEAEGEGAFNPETGEINWDCPCLGGMAHGPCGPEFREAFSCFVFSQEEPKGVDCIDRFRNMQDCFRKYPEIYGAELADDPSENDAASSGLDSPASAQSDGPQSSNSTAPSSPTSQSTNAPAPGSLTSEPSSRPATSPATKVSEVGQDTLEEAQAKRDRAEEGKRQVERDFGEQGAGVPTEAEDARKRDFNADTTSQ